MSSLNTCDPSLIPLITNLQTSLKATVNKPDGVAKRPDMTAAPVTTATTVTAYPAAKKDEALSEFSHNENPFFDNIDEKVNFMNDVTQIQPKYLPCHCTFDLKPKL